MQFWKEFLTDWVTYAALAALTAFLGIAYLAIA